VGYAYGCRQRVVFYSSTRQSTLTSTRVLVNTGSTLIQVANVEEGVVGQHTWGLNGRGLKQA